MARNVAQSIVEHLCRTAYVADGQYNWMGMALREESAGFAFQALGPDLYGGTSGIGLFLAESYAQSGDKQLHRAAVGALHHALSRLDQFPTAATYGFYAGVTGVAFAAARSGTLLGCPELIDRAHAALTDMSRVNSEGCLLDVIAGAAGAIPALLVLSRDLQRADLSDLAFELGRRIVAGAEKSGAGWSWGEQATGFAAERHLTGLSHGAAGMGRALFELYASSGEAEFLDGAKRAFQYENRWLDETEGNWPDFREYDGDDGFLTFMVAWCHGAPGIGLSRLRALEIRPDESLERDLGIAVRSARTALSDPESLSDKDYSLCHGTAGVGEFLLETGRTLHNDDEIEVVWPVASAGAACYLASPERWPCGVRGGSNPSLMLGLAGIGHFYLRLSDPSVPSLLLPGRRREA